MQYLQPNTTLQGGKYRIERVLGQGGFGITYLAEQVSLGRKVAVKEFFIENLCDRSVSESTIMRTISSGSVQMVDRYKQKFLKEARIISELHHENIINVYDVFEENGTAYYVMEYIDGGSLGGLLLQKGKLTEDEAVNHIKKIANAVEYIHQRQINHFDIKPDNIMLRRDGTPILIDFGISKRYDYAGTATTTTPVGISEGYAPIEQYSPDGVISFSPQTDIYSLGATLYKLVTGQTPPSAPARSGGASFNLPTTLSPSIRNAINMAMKLYKHERIGTAKQFIDTLAGVAEPKGKSVWKYVVGLIVVGLIVVGLTIAGSNENRPASYTEPVDTVDNADTAIVDNNVLDSSQDTGMEPQFETTKLNYIKNENDIDVEIIVDYPSKGNEELLNNTRSYINTTIAEMFDSKNKIKDNLSDGESILNYYGTRKYKEISAEKAKMGGAGFEETITIDKCFENENVVSFNARSSFYHGGVVNYFSRGASFRKDIGRRIYVIKNYNYSGFRELIKNALKNKLGEEYETILEHSKFAENDFENSPWPEEQPYLTEQGVRFDYQHYEIGPGYLGQISIVIPYSNIKEYLNDEAKTLLVHF